MCTTARCFGGTGSAGIHLTATGLPSGTPGRRTQRCDGTGQAAGGRWQAGRGAGRTGPGLGARQPRADSAAPRTPQGSPGRGLGTRRRAPRWELSAPSARRLLYEPDFPFCFDSGLCSREPQSKAGLCLRAGATVWRVLTSGKQKRKASPLPRQARRRAPPAGAGLRGRVRPQTSGFVSAAVVRPPVSPNRRSG